MKRLRTAFWLALCALVALASAARADELRVEVTGVDPDTVLVRAPDGDELGPASQRLLPPDASLEGAYYTISSRDAVSITVPFGRAFTVWFSGSPRGFGVVVREVRGTSAVRLVRWELVTAPAGGAVALDVDGAGGAVLRTDANGDGTPDATVAPTATLTGAAAADETRPTIEHERLADGRHALRLLDGGADITSPARLFVSVDGGRRYRPYQGPVAVDPRATPTLLAIGRDDAGNSSGVARFSTAPDLCARVADERAGLQALVAGVVAGAVADGLLPAPGGVAALVHGPAACLLRRDASGADVACNACRGVHAPGYGVVDVALLVPDAVGAEARATLAARLRAAAAADPRVAAVRTVVASRSAFEGATAPPRADDQALAQRLRALLWALAGEYLEGLAGTPLATVAERARSAGIPRADGHEAARLAEQSLLGTGVLLRFPGQARGAVPAEPERDSFENRLLRDQLVGAADAAALAALGRFAADACAAPLWTVTRDAYATSACGGAGCRTLGAFAAARAGAVRGSCPSLVDDALAAALVDHALVSTGDASVLGALFADECRANEHLGQALLRVRALAEQSAGDWQAALAGEPPAERERREAALAELDAARAARLAGYTVDWKLRLAYGGAEPLSGVVLRMLEDGAPTGQERVLDVPPRTALVVEGDAAAGRPFFVRRDVAASAPNEIHQVVFELDPHGSLTQETEGARFASFDYYVLDPAAPICPARRPLLEPLPEEPTP